MQRKNRNFIHNLRERQKQLSLVLVSSVWEWLNPWSWFLFLGYWLMVVVILSVLLSAGLGIISFFGKKKK